MKILVLDDEPLILKLVAIQLAALGEENVRCLTDPHEALKMLGEGAKTRLVFCDLQMPQMDGVEFVRNLGAIKYGGGVVLMSGEEPRILQTVSRLAAAHGLHVVGALRKPVQSVELERLLADYFHARETAARSGQKVYTADELRHALAHNELVNFYQPKVTVDQGVPIGVETLVRWRHPTDGIVLPGRFIECAEEHGLIDELMRIVFRNAVQQLAKWRRAEIDLTVAVNVSTDNLRLLDFPDFVFREAELAGVPLDRIVIEVTENRLMADSRVPLDILTRLRLRHVGLSIDGFGTGNTSLAQLRDIPSDEMKIDRSFIHGGVRDPAQRAIVEASLSIARQLDMKSVSEGVEDAADWDFIRRLGFDAAQGYFIAHPMLGEKIAPWIADWMTSAARREIVPAGTMPARDPSMLVLREID